jgi:hypothetical protein
MEYVILAGALVFVSGFIAGVLSRKSSAPLHCGVVVVSSSAAVILASWYLDEPRCHEWLRQMGIGSGDKFEFLTLDIFAMAIFYLGGSALVPAWGYVLGRLTKLLFHYRPFRSVKHTV